MIETQQGSEEFYEHGYATLKDGVSSSFSIPVGKDYEIPLKIYDIPPERSKIFFLISDIHGSSLGDKKNALASYKAEQESIIITPLNPGMIYLTIFIVDNTKPRISIDPEENNPLVLNIQIVPNDKTHIRQ